MHDKLYSSISVGDHVVIHGPEHDTMTIGTVVMINELEQFACVEYLNDWNCKPPKLQNRWRPPDKMIKVDSDAVILYHLKNAEKGER